MRKRGLAACLFALALGACASAPVRTANSALGMGELTVEKERELTADVARQIRQGVPLISDPILLSYVNEMGQAIVATTEPQPFVYRFAIVRDKALNAFTIGGGYIYLHSGVLTQVGNASELAGVLAHEIAHVRKRHIAQRAEGQGVATLATLVALAAVALSGADPALLALPQGLNVALQLKHTREAEAEADHAGLEYMVRAGYEPSGMARFFQRILAEQPSAGSEIPPYLYSHPALAERISTARGQIARLELPPRTARDDALPRAAPLAEQRDVRLAAMQARLHAVLEPVAGGSGLLAKPEFDRAKGNEALAQGEVARGRALLAEADAVLAAAQEQEPFDPRLPLARAELAEQKGDLAAAADHLARAFELDPAVPLIQHKLGIIHSKLGHRTRAAFYLEQAVGNYRPGSPAHGRAELDLELLATPLFDGSGLSGSVAPGVFQRGRPVRWSARIGRRYLERNPAIDLLWRDPKGAVAKRETVRMGPLGGVTGALETEGLTPGSWTLAVEVGETEIETHRFTLR